MCYSIPHREGADQKAPCYLGHGLQIPTEGSGAGAPLSKAPAATQQMPSGWELAWEHPWTSSWLQTPALLQSQHMTGLRFTPAVSSEPAVPLQTFRHQVGLVGIHDEYQLINEVISLDEAL